jgi:hypothetical protein
MTPSGVLGIPGNASIANQNAPQTAAQEPAEDDDGPDCTGGSSALIVQNTKTRQLTDAPHPLVCYSRARERNYIHVEIENGLQRIFAPQSVT